MKRSGSEKLITSDWRTMDLKDKYDLILGDLSINMVHYNDWSRILIRLRKALNNNGLIVHRMWMRLPNRYKTWKSVISNYRRRKHLNPLTSSMYPLIQLMYDDKERRVYYAQGIVPAVKEAYGKGMLPKKVYKYFYDFLSPYKMPNSPETTTRTNTMFSKYFKIKSIRYSKD